MRKSVHTTALIAIAALLVTSLHGVTVASSFSESDSLRTGPYVDEVIFRVIVDPSQRILALQAGTIEMDNSFFNPSYLEQLDADPDIDIFRAFRNGYGHITINCRDYPLNISGFRRAFAYAYNKSDYSGGYCLTPFYKIHDSLLPYVNGFCIEDEFDWHYYDAEVAKGNEILDNLNFEIDSETGYRLAPNGEPFDIIVEYAAACGTPGVVIQAVDALHSLYIDAKHRSTDFNKYISRLDSHGEYDMVFYAINFYSNDVDWLAYDYWSEYADVYGENPTNFRNATYDIWRNQLLQGITYEEVYEAAAEMQKILQYNVPRLVVYENTYMQGYRNDQFKGHVEDLGRYISGPWTQRKIQKLDGTFGGSVPIAMGQEPDSFNIYVTNSAYSTAILSNLYSSLFKYGPDLKPWPDLAESLLTETHSTNPAVPDGHTRFTFDIIQNATWSDGTPLTADDVVFTYVYQYESGKYENPAGAELGDLVAAYTPIPYRVVLEFSTESYWHFSDFAFDYIIPQHIFNDADGIGYEGWYDWNPVLNATDPHVTCGPFIFTDHEGGDYYTISRNPLFHYAASPSVPTNETTTSTTTANQTTTQETYWLTVISTALISGTGIVIVFYVVVRFQNRKS